MVPAAQIAYSLDMAKAAVKAAAENRGQDVTVLDLTGVTSLFDFFILITGGSRRQLAAIADEIERALKAIGEKKLSVSGLEEGRWVVMDYGSIVIHLFDDETRSFYNLENLWADGKPVDVSDIVQASSATMARHS
ncbi:MAG: ribosome silencing factor [Candidatus Moraniibacteriota bacterium]|nr:ribosome silencing factor [Planctomycetota bacterium]TXH01626.1 MAG: ribosome silencing factor [Candidatus Moranbacteria bacterium]